MFRRNVNGVSSGLNPWCSHHRSALHPLDCHHSPNTASRGGEESVVVDGNDTGMVGKYGPFLSGVLQVLLMPQNKKHFCTFYGQPVEMQILKILSQIPTRRFASKGKLEA